MHNAKAHSPHPLAIVAALSLFFPPAFAQTLQEPAPRLYLQRGKIQSINPTDVVLEAVDLPPTTFHLTPSTENGFLKPGELVQITFTIVDNVKVARIIAEIVATSVNLPGASTSRSARTTSASVPRDSSTSSVGNSTSVTLPTGSTREGSSTVAGVGLPIGSGSAPAPVSAAPISLAADESQLIHMHAPEIHQSGVLNPIRLAIFNLQPESAADINAEMATSISDRLASLLHNDGLFSLLDRSKLPASPIAEMKDPAAVIALAKTLDEPDAILLGEIKEEIPAEPSSDGSRRHKIQAVFPTIVLEGRLYDAHTGHLLGTPKGIGGGSQDRTDDRISPILRAVRDAIESLATAIDPEYPPLLDPRTFATVVSVESNHIAVAFPGVPPVQIGNRLQVSHPVWFTRDPATGNIIAVPTEPLGTFIVTGIEKPEASGTYQGTAPSLRQTIRLSR